MLPIAILVQILLIFTFVCKCEENLGQDELISVAVIFRHGDRTPIEPYPNDPYKNVSNWPVGFGQLTNRGKSEQFELGRWLRSRYDNFLPRLYSKDDIRVISTDLDRTLMSALSNLAGLYPPVEKQVWNKNLSWQPIPVHTVPVALDDVLGMTRSCARFDLLLQQLQNSPKFIKLKKLNRDLFSYVSANSGQEINDFYGALSIYNTLFIEELYNFSLPDWTKAVYPTKLRPLAEFAFAISTYTSDLARFKVGTLFDKISRQLSAISTHERPKFTMYSAHDTTIAAVLNSLHIFEYHTPPYTATIIFELRKSSGVYYVNVLYKNASIPQEMILEGCIFDCPLDKFLAILEPLSLSSKQWVSECKLQYLGFVPYEFIEDNYYVGIFSLLGLLLLCAASIILIKIRRDKQGQYLILPHDEF